jgi:hypothetical protein
VDAVHTAIVAAVAVRWQVELLLRDRDVLHFGEQEELARADPQRSVAQRGLVGAQGLVAGAQEPVGAGIDDAPVPLVAEAQEAALGDRCAHRCSLVRRPASFDS